MDKRKQRGSTNIWEQIRSSRGRNKCFSFGSIIASSAMTVVSWCFLISPLIRICQLSKDYQFYTDYGKTNELRG